MITTIVTVASLAVLLLELCFVVLSIAAKKRPERIAFIRSFKKGKCAVIYLTAIPLYCVGHVYAGESFLNAFFGAINKIINLVVLKYETASIALLMQDDALYRFTVYFCFALVGVNALFFTISVTNQHIWCAAQAFRAMTTGRDKLFLFGNNGDNVAIYHSDTKRNKTVIDDISEQSAAALYLDKVAYISTRTFERPINHIFGLIRRFEREYVVIVNTHSDEKNLQICRLLVSNISTASQEMKERYFSRLKVFVFGDPRYEAIYEDVIGSGYGCIRYVNKYQKIAMDFIDNYPFTRFMDDRQIDFDTSLIRKDVNINALLIGFGKTNQQLFLTSVANNQFLTEGDGGPVLKKVNYVIFDKEATENNKNLNHSYYRYKYECADVNPADYLPLPTPPANDEYLHKSISDPDFYTQIRKVVTADSRDANFIVIAFGSDLENIDMAQKLLEKRREWNINNLVIFVKVRVWHKEETLLEDENCYFIGNEHDVVYNIDRILGDKIFRMAKMRNEVYDLEYDITHNENLKVDEEYVAKNRENANKNWHISKSQMERESSLYGCLSLRTKLHLMGLDYCERENDEDVGMSNDEYLSLYAGDDLPDTKTHSLTANGKPIVFYSLDFPPSRRRTMAIHEHQRWNSFMISKGVIPAPISLILSETTLKNGKTVHTNGKNYRVRRHGNITTFDGLVEFRRLIAERDGCSEDKVDVIKYDYQLLDDAHWLLSQNGYKIIKKSKK